MSNVEKFYPANSQESPDNILEQAQGELSSVLVLGWDKDGDLYARASLDLKDGGDVLWLLERVKHNLMSGAYQE